ncbi:MAG: hypothetical protein IPP74_07565 [Alphaproteobacteria bacterium]|nr:hypothetical protein [Alphaproteobacteria bacterium]
MVRGIKYLMLSGLFGILSISSTYAESVHPHLNYALPFVEKEWTKSIKADGSCVLSTGHNGFDVVIRNGHTGIYSTRDISPGVFWQIRTEQNVYRTSAENFPDDMVAGILSNLKTTHKAYVEWSEPNHKFRSHLRISTIVTMDGFSELLNQCTHSR